MTPTQLFHTLSKSNLYYLSQIKTSLVSNCTENDFWLEIKIHRAHCKKKHLKNNGQWKVSWGILNRHILHFFENMDFLLVTWVEDLIFSFIRKQKNCHFFLSLVLYYSILITNFDLFFTIFNQSCLHIWVKFDRKKSCPI